MPLETRLVVGGIELGIEDSSNLELLDEIKSDELDADEYGGGIAITNTVTDYYVQRHHYYH